MTAHRPPDRHLRAALPRPRQRWFAGKGRPYVVTGVERARDGAGAPLVELWLVHVDEDGRVRAPTTSSSSTAGARRSGSTHVLVGRHEGRLVYDALHDREVTDDCGWPCCEASRSSPGLRGAPRRHRAAARGAAEPGHDRRAEQHLAGLRRHARAQGLPPRRRPGMQPRRRGARRPGARPGCTHVAQPFGWIEADVRRRRLRPGVPRRRRRGLGARHEQRARPAARGRPARRRGRRRLRGRVRPARRGHRRGARRPARVAAHRPLGPRTSCAARADLLARAPRRRGARWRRSCEPFAEVLAARLRRARGPRGPGAGATGPRRPPPRPDDARDVSGWKILDFEGEPARPVSERRALDSPLRDVAGMLRSFDYAAHQLRRSGTCRPTRRPSTGPASGPRATATRSAPGYAQRGRPDPRDQDVLLRAYEADKVVYEVVYEARMRPSLGVDPARGARTTGRLT